MAAEVAQEEKVLDEIKNRIDTNAENPEELQKIKTELEQKIQEAKEVDPENGGEAEQELLDDVNKKLETSGSAEATEEKPEEKPDGESTTEEPKDGEGTDKRVEDNEAGKNGNVKDINDEEEQERLGESIEG
jgi:hypothetical protein